MSIEVGDAVFKFLGDSSNLDAQFNSLGPKAQAAFVPATQAAEGFGNALKETGVEAEKTADVVEDAGERSRASVGEARGEVALLGEAFGVHLPRHVRSFVAELPGVGQALSAAFAATAVLFIIEALVKLAEKGSEAAASFLYLTHMHEEETKAIIALNGELEKLGKEYVDLKKKADDWGKSALQLAQQNQQAAQKSVKDLSSQMKELTAELVKGTQAVASHEGQVLSSSHAWQLWKSNQVTALEALRGWLSAEAAGEIRAKSLSEAQNKLTKTGEELKNANVKVKVSTHEVSDAQDELAKKVKAAEDKLSESVNKLNEMYQKVGRTIEVVRANDITIDMPEQVKRILQYRGAAEAMGITLRSDLVQALDTARVAKDRFVQAAGTTDVVALKKFDMAIREAKKELDDYGKSLDKLKAKGEVSMKGLKQDLKQGADASHELAAAGTQAFDQLAKGMEAAVAASILGQKSFGAALEEATAKALAQLAAQALVKSLFYTAEGFAALAGFAAGPAGEYFEAAGIMAAVGAAAGLSARALSGAGGSGSSSTQTGNTSRSDTGGQSTGRGSGVGVQHFAMGGLVTEPTLAMIGEEKRKEVVLPLEDSRVMSEVAKSIGGNGGGLTVHVHGHVIGARDVAHLTEQINKRVNRGQASLLASNSLRVTKRSA